jgi:hypothetical protein
MMPQSTFSITIPKEGRPTAAKAQEVVEEGGFSNQSLITFLLDPLNHFFD